MDIILGLLFGIAFIAAALFILKAMSGERQIMSYNDYLRDYGSVADSHPEKYSNHNDY
jgi:hypothetical protein